MTISLFSAVVATIVVISTVVYILAASLDNETEGLIHKLGWIVIILRLIILFSTATLLISLIWSLYS